jgi:hypothetical protein|tara:strand:- start:669 stop:860 length:192 start_codon:yes stop_codon:yes gene_type:complete
MDIVSYVMQNWNLITDVVLKLVGAFAIIASMTPNTNDNKAAQMLADLVNLLGFNIGKSKNSDV